MGKQAKGDIRERFGFAVKDRREALGLTCGRLESRREIRYNSVF